MERFGNLGNFGKKFRENLGQVVRKRLICDQLDSQSSFQCFVLDSMGQPGTSRWKIDNLEKLEIFGGKTSESWEKYAGENFGKTRKFWEKPGNFGKNLGIW